MKLLLFVVVSVTTLVSPLAVQVREQSERTRYTAEEQEVLEVDRQLLEAGLRSDAAALDRIYAADVMFIGNDGRVWNKSERIEVFRSGERDWTSSKDEDVRVRVYQGTAVLTKRNAITGALEGRAINSRSVLTRLYVREQGRWQLVHQHSTRLEQR